MSQSDCNLVNSGIELREMPPLANWKWYNWRVSSGNRYFILIKSWPYTCLAIHLHNLGLQVTTFTCLCVRRCFSALSTLWKIHLIPLKRVTETASHFFPAHGISINSLYNDLIIQSRENWRDKIAGRWELCCCSWSSCCCVCDCWCYCR